MALSETRMKSIFQAVHEIEMKGQAAALATVVRARGSVPRHEGSKMIVFPDGRIEGTVGGGEMESRVIRDALGLLTAGQSRVLHYELIDPASGDPGVCGGEVEIFVEPIKPTPTVVVIGAGHVGKAVAHLAKWLGFRVAVSDDRPEYASPQNIPEADAFYPVPMSELPEAMAINDQTYLVLTTRGVPIDIPGLPHLLDTPAAYLGVIGSRRRWATAMKQLEERGVPPEKLARVHAPMGLELNAETPEEIAVSIMAEIVMLRRGGTGESMKWTAQAES